MNEKKCEFNPEEPCHPIACLARAQGAVSASDSMLKLYGIKREDGEVEERNFRAAKILINVRDCAFKMVLALKNEHLLKEKE